MERKRKVRVLVVDDSLLFREAVVRGISADPGIEVVGTASDPYAARDKIIEMEPDVLTLDVVMPKMSGIEFLRKLMPQYPLPVVVVSAIGGNVFDALDAGAVDYVTKPGATPEAFKAFINELIIKIKIATMAKVGRLKREYAENSIFPSSGKEMRGSVIAIGASTGGTDAIYQVIKDLPRDTPGVVVVQHMPPGFTGMYAERLNNTCRMEVKEAENGDEVMRGRALIAPGDCQMELKRDANRYYVRLFKGEKVSGHCPSVDVLFNSLAENAPRNSVGVILTGMGSDGAKGLMNMKKKGHLTIGQDEKTCVVYGMPMVAFNIGAVAIQAPLDRIAGILLEHLRS